MSPEEAREHATAILIDHAPSYTDGDVEIVATAIFLDDFPDARVAGNKSVDGLMDEYRQNARAALDALAAAGRIAGAARPAVLPVLDHGRSEAVTGPCTETGCSALVSDVPGNRCDGPTGAGCGELFCGDHLFATERDGLLCTADYNRIEDRVADLDAQP